MYESVTQPLLVDFQVKVTKLIEAMGMFFSTVNPVLNGPSKRRLGFQNWFSKQIIAKCRSKVLQNAPRGAFCNTFDLH